MKYLSGEVMMSAVLHRVVEQTPTLAHRSKGAVISSAAGDLLDLSSGAGVTCLGHTVGPIKEAITEQLASLPYVHSANFTAEPVEQFARILCEDAGRTFDNGAVMFLSGGAEAVEAACKLGSQYYQEQGIKAPITYYARQYSYHGNTLFTLALGDHPRKLKYPQTQAFKQIVRRIPAYAPSHDHTTTVHRSLDGLETDVSDGHPFCVIVEPIGGTTLGIEPPDVEYLVELRRICHQYNGVLIYDEVLCGNWRTGHAFAWQFYQHHTDVVDLAPDIIVCGKGLTGGYLPLSAVICNKRVLEPIRAGSGRLWHSTTNQNHPLGCAAGVAAHSAYEQTQKHRTILQDLIMGEVCSTLMQIPIVTGVHGVGTLWGIRLDAARDGLHQKVRHECFRQGVSLYSDGQTIDGTGNMLLLAPPYGMGRNQLLRATEIVCGVLTQQMEDA